MNGDYQTKCYEVIFISVYSRDRGTIDCQSLTIHWNEGAVRAFVEQTGVPMVAVATPAITITVAGKVT